MTHVADASLFLFVAGVGSLGSWDFFVSPVFLAAAPVTLSGGSAFCGVQDLVRLIGGSREITIV